MEDQISELLVFIGGQLMTGKVQLPEHIGPSPLLRPATAIRTVGISLPDPPPQKKKRRKRILSIHYIIH